MKKNTDQNKKPGTISIYCFKAVCRNMLCMASAFFLLLMAGCGAADSASGDNAAGSMVTHVSDASGISDNAANGAGQAGESSGQFAGFTDEPVFSSDNIDPETGVFNNDLFDDSDNKSLLGDLPDTSDEGIDVDLTKLSSVVIYSVVFDMMQHPDDYKGKTIRMFGNYTTSYDEDVDIRYHACIIQDATQCCAQGIEFELTDGYTYPDDYPEAWDEITVVGDFDTYLEAGAVYCTLRDAKLE